MTCNNTSGPTWRRMLHKIPKRIISQDAWVRQQKQRLHFFNAATETIMEINNTTSDMENDLPETNGTYSSPVSIAVNVTNSTQIPYIEYSERPETYIVPILFALIFVVGVLGNGTLVLIFIRHRNMRNVPNTYIFSLALGDLLVIVTCVPFISTLYTVSRYFNPNSYRSLIDSTVCMLRHLRSKECLGNDNSKC
jgi:7 transmembrane receptor (rhodopsin family).